MLPAPISSRHRPRKPSYPSTYHSSSTSASFRDVLTARKLRVLFARSRVTNLAVLLLVAALVLSLLSNIRHWTWRALNNNELCTGVGSCFSRYASSTGVKSIEDTIERPVGLKELEHLIIVPGHGVWVGNDEGDAWREDKWILEAYPNQNRSMEGAKARIGAFIEHIRRGYVI